MLAKWLIVRSNVMAGNGAPMDPMRAQTYRTQRAELPEDL